MSKTLVVDGTNILMRSVRASERFDKPLSVMIDGEVYFTGGVYLFINHLSNYVRQENPDRIVVCWDSDRSDHRLAIDPDYKAARVERERSLEESLSFSLAKDFLSLNGIYHDEMDGVEADDLVAVYTRIASQWDEVVILSGDKDFLQLLGPRVTQIRPGVKPERWGVAEVKENLGCFPEDVPKYMALVGDTTDGISGVKGIGPKTATKLLEKWDWDFERMVSEEPRLKDHQDDARRSYALVDLRRWDGLDVYEEDDIPMFNPDPFEGPTYQELREWLTKYEMLTILSRVDAGVLWKEPVQGKLV